MEYHGSSTPNPIIDPDWLDSIVPNYHLRPLFLDTDNPEPSPLCPNQIFCDWFKHREHVQLVSTVRSTFINLFSLREWFNDCVRIAHLPHHCHTGHKGYMCMCIVFCFYYDHHIILFLLMHGYHQFSSKVPPFSFSEHIYLGTKTNKLANLTEVTQVTPHYYYVHTCTRQRVIRTGCMYTCSP